MSIQCIDCGGRLAPIVEGADTFQACSTCKKIYSKDGGALVYPRKRMGKRGKQDRTSGHDFESVYWVGELPLPLSIAMQKAATAVERHLLNQLPSQQIYGLTIYRLGVFDNTAYELVELVTGREYPPHRHKGSDGVFCFIFGEGVVSICNQDIQYVPGTKVKVPKGVYHGFRPKTHTLFLSIQSPPIIQGETVDIELF